MTLLLGILGAWASFVWRPSLALGILAGLAAVLLSRFLHLWLLGRAFEGKNRGALVTAGLGKYLLLSALALGIIAAGAPPLGVALGLFFYPLGLWLSLGAHVFRNR